MRSICKKQKKKKKMITVQVQTTTHIEKLAFCFIKLQIQLVHNFLSFLDKLRTLF